MDATQWFETVAGNSPETALVLREELLHSGLLLDNLHVQLAARRWEESDRECVTMLGCILSFERSKETKDRDRLLDLEELFQACPRKNLLVCAWAYAGMMGCSIRLGHDRRNVTNFYGLAMDVSSEIERDVARCDVAGFAEEEGARWLRAMNPDGAWEHWKRSAHVRFQRYRMLEHDGDTKRTTLAAAAATLVRMYDESDALFVGRGSEEFPIGKELVEGLREEFGDELRPAGERT
jgi:hypothetical protein